MGDGWTDGRMGGRCIVDKEIAGEDEITGEIGKE